MKKKKKRVRQVKLRKTELVNLMDIQFAQPEYITGGTLMDFQLEGVYFLKRSYEYGNNVILADEMGLGKTIQTLGFFYTLFQEKGLKGPFLVVAPLSTLENWKRECIKWCQEFTYHIHTREAYLDRSKDPPRSFPDYKTIELKIKKLIRSNFNLIITSYTYILNDVDIFTRRSWEAICVDECDRLKNRETKFAKNISLL